MKISMICIFQFGHKSIMVLKHQVFRVILERNSFQLLDRGSICMDDLLVILMDPRKSVIQGDQLLEKLKK